MRILLDTNVLVAALITKNTPPDLLYQAWRRGEFELVTSDAQLDELRRVLNYQKLRRFVSREEAKLLLETIDARARIVEDLPEVALSRDPHDNMILATAIKAGASLAVSGDKEGMLALEQVQGIPIVTPRAALARLSKKSGGD
ncbi:MAG TPA: putative toxin-antitoxin system toxin component, PIN family [Vicinamibacteria bacterium]|nr:putative toxin-antitoxin system toxin component, PIN family [Vicinamibacteria bacterium]